jgi:hypothetical protein
LALGGLFFVAGIYPLFTSIPQHDRSDYGDQMMLPEALDRSDFACRQNFFLRRRTPKGLLIGKKATFIIASGANYAAQTQKASSIL